MNTLRRFYRLASPFWFNHRQGVEWLLLFAVIGFALAIIQVSVYVTEWNKAFYDALAEFNGEIIPSLIITYLSYITLIVAFIVCGNLLRKVLIFRWREHLTRQFQHQWLNHHQHYRLQLENEPDNPDQRIAEDIYLLAEKSIDLFKYFIMNVAKLTAFIAILWHMSGVQTFHLGTWQVNVRGYLVWIALLYSILCTLFMHYIGHPLQFLNVERQHTEADYRAALLRIRDNAEQIAFYRGEKQEIRRLSERFHHIKQNWYALIRREFKIETFSATYLRISMFIPIFATLPMYLARTMTFGDMMQARSAFTNVQDGFGWFMDYYKRLIEWSAVIKRLADFQSALENHETPVDIEKLVQNSPHFMPSRLTAGPLDIYAKSGNILLTGITLNLSGGDWVLLDGKSGIGKSTLLRTLAGLWPYYQGEFKIRSDIALFLPQRPYLAHDSLRAVITYPASPLQYNDERLQQVLVEVGLPQLRQQLNDVKEWNKILSGGEQQRISLARVLLLRPTLLFLDESTNQLDENSAVALIRHIKSQLPLCLCLAVTHQTEVKKLFEQTISLK